MDTKNSVEQICLDVAAKVTATVTHEVNNALAVINENAGYLDDLVVMVGADGEVPADRIQRSVSSVASQVRRANKLMKDLNHFAHTGDEPVATIDLVELMQIMINLTGRKAASAEMSVMLVSTEPVIVNTKPQIAYALMFYCLTHLYQAAHGVNVVDCEVCRSESEDLGSVVRFKGWQGMGKSLSDLVENSGFSVLAGEIEAGVEADDTTIVMMLPHSLSF